MALNTQGTNLYFIDPESGTVKTVGCPTGISGISAPREEREVTCLEDVARAYEAGMLTPGSATINLNFDPQDPTHAMLHDLYKAGTSLIWGIGFSDGTNAPTVGSDDDMDFPDDRSFLRFEGYVSDYPFEFAIAANVTSGLSVRMSGEINLIIKSVS
jgi:hypothetical protein